MEDFTPWSALAGGALIGASASLLLALDGKVAGISGIVAGLLRPRGAEAWRLWFVGGLVSGGLALVLLDPGAFPAAVPRSAGVLVLAGLLVGVGTRLGSGCTSGHGVCGVSRLSVRSLAATITFMAAGVATVFLFEHVLGGGR